MERLAPALSSLLDAAAAAGDVRDDVDAEDLLYAIAQLCQPVPGRGPEHGRRMPASRAADRVVTRMTHITCAASEVAAVPWWPRRSLGSRPSVRR
jgi:hypothetical protein